jgi:hypothetical protein
MSRGEAAYQRRLVGILQELFPGCYILKNDPAERQGVPDLLILYGPCWAMLEVKLSADAEVQPNQEYYVEMFGNMSFAAFIYPEVEEQVLYDLQHAFGSIR